MITPIKDGIYFGLPEETYLAVERLSKSGIKKLRVSPADFYDQSWLNPKPKDLTPEQERRQALALYMGRAYHAARLEPEKFASTYVRELTKAEMPDGSLFTADQMKDEIRTRNEGRDKEAKLKLSGTTEAIAISLADDGFPKEKLWHLAFNEWERGLADNALKLEASSFDEILEDGRRLHLLPSVKEHLSGGAAEVSVFWTCPDTGIPMKARIDYLKPASFTELKTFANPNGKNLYKCLTDAIQYNRYYIDAVSYLQAIEAIASPSIEIIGDATDAEIDLITALKERGGRVDCHLIFQQKEGVPNILERKFHFFQSAVSDEAIAELERDGASAEHLERARRFKEIADGEPVHTAIHTKARLEIKAAKKDFLAYSEIYSSGEAWLPLNPSGDITDDDFHPNWLERL